MNNEAGFLLAVQPWTFDVERSLLLTPAAFPGEGGGLTVYLKHIIL